jgi:hypothetical protein
MKNKFIIFINLLILNLFIASCEKDPSFRTFNYPVPVTSGISPSSGYIGTTMTITGTNFDTLIGAVKVWFGGVQATTIVSCTNNQIVVQVPSNAVSGKVSLQVWTNKVDSIGTFSAIQAPVINLNYTANTRNNIAYPGDTVYIKGVRFGTDVSKVSIKFSGTSATNVPSINDTLIKVITPNGYSSGNVTITMGGLNIIGTPALINPNAPGNLTPYFLSNTGDTTKGGGFITGTSPLVSSRWGTLATPWITNAAAKNKSGAGGYSSDAASGGIAGSLCWETWNNTPIVDGIVYQPTSMPLTAGNYTLFVKYYSEIQQNSSVYFVVAAGNSGIPTFANISTAVGSVALASPANVGSSSPNLSETKSFNFTLSSSQVVSIGFLANMKWGNGTANPGCYIRIDWIKLVKNS